MEINKNNIHIRPYTQKDFDQIHELNKNEQWNNLVKQYEDTKEAWANSNVAYVACINEQIIGYIRGLTDGYVTMYISELLIDPSFRALGIGTMLLKYAHEQYPKTRIDLLASVTSKTFYEEHGFRAFYGYRKTFPEW